MHLSVSVSALKELMLKERQGYTTAERMKGVHEKPGTRRKGERKGVKECNDNVRFMQPCTAEELANAALVTFSRPLHSSIPALPRAAAALMQLQSGVSLGERKLRELHRGLLCA